MILYILSILHYFASKARENANLKKEEFLFFSKNIKRKTTKKGEMVTYALDGLLRVTTNFINMIVVLSESGHFSRFCLV